jgi:hypothetical protein
MVGRPWILRTVVYESGTILFGSLAVQWRMMIQYDSVYFYVATEQEAQFATIACQNRKAHTHTHAPSGQTKAIWLPIPYALSVTRTRHWMLASACRTHGFFHKRSVATLHCIPLHCMTRVIHLPLCLAWRGRRWMYCFLFDPAAMSLQYFHHS